MEKKNKKGKKREKVKRNILSKVPEEHPEYGTGEVIIFQYYLHKCGMFNAYSSTLEGI